jgi:hypothetical protein
VKPAKPQPARLGFTIYLAWLWLAVSLLYAGPIFAARIEVSLDRNPVPLGESFTLTFSADETPDGDPDFSPLQKDFEILGQSQSNQFSLNNGHASRSIEWQLTVMAKQAGKLDIPSIAFGEDRSAPFSVTILQGAAGRNTAADAEVFLEVEAEPKNPYVQAQVMYTVRVLSRVQFGEAHLSGPEAGDALIQKLEGEQQGFTNRNGVRYRITEIRYAVFPQKSGRLHIDPVRLDAQIPSGGRSLFGQFFNPATRSRRLQSEAVELEVRPAPAEFSGKHWLPAASLELEDSWARKPPQIASGEPITRTLAVKAEGATVGLLPELNPETPPSGDIKQYPDQPLLNEEKRADGLASVRQEKTALIVSQPGTYRMPAVEIPWWNTKTDRMEVARLPERILTVLPSARTPSREPPPQPASEAPPKPEPASSSSPEAGAQPAAPAPAGNLWFWLALLFGLGWLGTAIAWWLSRRTRKDRPAAQPLAGEIPSERRLVEAVERACRANDPAAARRALAAWADHRWPGSGAEALERHCGGDFGREIALLNRSLYAPGGADWQGTALWQGFRACLAAEKPAGRPPAVSELEPLYKS